MIAAAHVPTFLERLGADASTWFEVVVTRFVEPHGISATSELRKWLVAQDIPYEFWTN